MRSIAKNCELGHWESIKDFSTFTNLKVFQITKYESDIKIDKFKMVKLIKNRIVFLNFHILYIDFAILNSSILTLNSYSAFWNNFNEQS